MPAAVAPKNPALPAVPTAAELPQGLYAISPETVVRLILGMPVFSDGRANPPHVILDSRFAFEFEAGHLKGARRVDSVEQIKEQFFPGTQQFDNPLCVIVHCEFSQARGPRTVRVFRQHDRQMVGIANYPRLYYPNVFLLEGGFKGFWEGGYDRACIDGSYRPMADPHFAEECRQAMTQYRGDRRVTQLLTRALQSGSPILPSPKAAKPDGNDVSLDRSAFLDEAIDTPVPVFAISGICSLLSSSPSCATDSPPAGSSFRPPPITCSRALPLSPLSPFNGLTPVPECDGLLSARGPRRPAPGIASLPLTARGRGSGFSSAEPPIGRFDDRRWLAVDDSIFDDSMNGEF
jgi:rhodanese-related sulfurtransferase